MTLADNLRKIRGVIRNRKLVVITKGIRVDRIQELVRLGVRCFGENYVAEAEQKISKLKAEWHMTGHLPPSEAKEAVSLFDVVQTLDSPKLAYKLDKAAKKLNKVQDVMVQVNISQDPQRYGIRPVGSLHFVKELTKLQNVRVIGLMAMAPLVEASATKPYFRQMKVIYDVVRKHVPTAKYLSMGMSHDYKQAVEEGANMLRIGAALFG